MLENKILIRQRGRMLIEIIQIKVNVDKSLK